MILIELMEVMNESANLAIICQGRKVSEYNGRDSIDEKYNTRQVLQIDIENNSIIAEIAE